MEFVQTNIAGIVLIKPKVFGDSRGYLMESFRHDLFSQYVGEINFIQENESKSTYGVLRGFHYQLPPYAQSKLVRVVTGRVLDVAVDIRKGSPTFGQHLAVELSAQNKHQLFISRGFAHGFAVLSKEAVFVYKMDAPYAPDHECGIFYADPALGANWGLPSADIRLSDKDKGLPLLKNAKLFDMQL